MKSIYSLVILFSCPNVLACYDPPLPKYKAPAFLDYSYLTARWDELDAEYLPDVLMDEFSAPSSKSTEEAQFDPRCTNWNGGGCETNTCDNAALFLQAAISAKVKPADLAELKRIREAMLGKCGEEIRKDEALKALAMISDVKSKPFAQYLSALVYFYSWDYQKAYEIFGPLSSAPATSAWPVETAAYVKCRVKLIASQEKWDGNSAPKDVVNQDLVMQADTCFKQYLEIYPQGLYTKSAKNFEHRILFLKGEKNKLNAAILANTNVVLSSSNDPAVFQPALNEFQNNYTGPISPKTDHLVLIGKEWVRRAKDLTTTALRLHARDVELLEQNPLRAKYPRMFTFVKALGLHATGQFKRLAALDDQTYSPRSKMAVSTRVLKAGALMQLKQYDDAIKVFLMLKKELPDEEVFDLHIVQALIKSGKKFEFFDRGTLLASDKITRDLLLYVYSNQELSELLSRSVLMPKNRNFIAQELMRRHLVKREYAAMLKLYAVSGVDFGIFTTLKANAEKLAREPNDLALLLTVGRFIYDNDLTASSALGGFKELDVNELSLFIDRYDDFKAETTYPPFAYFKDVADAFSQTNERNDLEAESLHRLVQCFGGVTTHKRSVCLKEPEGKNESEGWFKRLHAKYAKSPWAKKTKYYY